MTRIHDIGGRFGDGAVHPEQQGTPILAHDWQKRTLAMTLACGSLGLWNIDASRHARESLTPKDYTRFSYFERWIAALADLLERVGAATRDEFAGKAVNPAPPGLAAKVLAHEMVGKTLAAGNPTVRSGGSVRYFAIGQVVRTRRPAGNRLVPGGHTRLPNYAAGALGRILLIHGSHVLPDSNAHWLGEAPEPLYSVAFPASELWCESEHSGDEVILDLWHSYLDPV